MKTSNVSIAAAQWVDISQGAAKVLVQLGSIGKGYIAVTDTTAQPTTNPDDAARPFHRIINREPAQFSELASSERVWLWLPTAMVVAVTR